MGFQSLRVPPNFSGTRSACSAPVRIGRGSPPPPARVYADRAVAAPMPDDAPVTSTTALLISIEIVPYLVRSVVSYHKIAILQ
jgi:hypothetical protein